MKYALATRTRADARVLACVLTFFLLIIKSPETRAQSNLRWSAGARTGFYYEYYTLKQKSQRIASTRSVRDGMCHQLFLNFSPGKKNRLMLETSLGYNAYTSEQVSYGPFVNDTLSYYAYTHERTRVLSLGMEAKYKVLTWPKLRWQHYAGLSISLHRQYYKAYSFGNSHNPYVYERREFAGKTWYNYFGFVYSGKINISTRLSAQYNVNYAFASSDYTPMSEISFLGEPTTKRLGVGFGFGYNF